MGILETQGGNAPPPRPSRPVMRGGLLAPLRPRCYIQIEKKQRAPTKAPKNRRAPPTAQGKRGMVWKGKTSVDDLPPATYTMTAFCCCCCCCCCCSLPPLGCTHRARRPQLRALQSRTAILPPSTPSITGGRRRGAAAGPRSPCRPPPAGCVRRAAAAAAGVAGVAALLPASAGAGAPGGPRRPGGGGCCGCCCCYCLSSRAGGGCWGARACGCCGVEEGSFRLARGLTCSTFRGGGRRRPDPNEPATKKTRTRGGRGPARAAPPCRGTAAAGEGSRAPP